jgi:hypothetical protein
MTTQTCDRTKTAALLVVSQNDLLSTLIRMLATFAAVTVLATLAVAQSAKEVRGPSSYVVIENEPAPRLIVDSPLRAPLARCMFDNNTIDVPGQPSGRRKMLIELVNAGHHAFTGQSVMFTVPAAPN